MSLEDPLRPPPPLPLARAPTPPLEIPADNLEVVDLDALLEDLMANPLGEFQVLGFVSD